MVLKLAKLNTVEMTGVAGGHRGAVEWDALTTPRNASITRLSPSRSLQTAYGKNAVMALRFD